jgi:MATE family multidrug resistance protein
MLIAVFGYWVIGIGVGMWLAFLGRLGRGRALTGLATGLGLVAALLIWRWDSSRPGWRSGRSATT